MYRCTHMNNICRGRIQSKKKNYVTIYTWVWTTTGPHCTGMEKYDPFFSGTILSNFVKNIFFLWKSPNTNNKNWGKFLCISVWIGILSVSVSISLLYGWVIKGKQTVISLILLWLIYVTTVSYIIIILQREGSNLEKYTIYRVPKKWGVLFLFCILLKNADPYYNLFSV